MAEHPPVTLTPEQNAQAAIFYPYQITPALQERLLLLSGILTEMGVALALYAESQQKHMAQQDLQAASKSLQTVLAYIYGTPIQPSWVTVAEEGQQPAPQQEDLL